MFKVFFRGEGLEERMKTRLTFARFLFTATPRHERLARKKNSKDWTFDDFFNYIFLWLLSAQGQCIIEKIS